MLQHIQEHEGVFNPEEVRILTAAFDDAWKAVQDSGAEIARNGQAEAMRAIIAQRILAMARLGERDALRVLFAQPDHFSNDSGIEAVALGFQRPHSPAELVVERAPARSLSPPVPQATGKRGSASGSRNISKSSGGL
jgi:hypothetical protein